MLGTQSFLQFIKKVAVAFAEFSRTLYFGTFRAANAQQAIFADAENRRTTDLDSRVDFSRRQHYGKSKIRA